MEESQNPYAAPLTVGRMESESSVRSVRRHPWFSRTLTVLLALNAISLISIFVLEAILDAVFLPVRGAEPPLALILLFGLTSLWMAFAWPIVSLAALVYSVTVDRGMPRSLLKAVIAFFMFGAWMLFLTLILLA